MFKEAIFHQPYNNYAYPIGTDKLFVQIRVKKGEMKKVQILFGDRYSGLWQMNMYTSIKEMTKYDSDRLYDYYKVELYVKAKRFKYLFLLDDGIEQLYYTMYGFYDEIPCELGHFQYTYLCECDIYITPDWVQKGIFYEIMVDRFFNGNPDRNPEYVLPWTDIPKEPEENPLGNCYGGDIDGIIEKLDYLEELGITAIYLTPIFKSASSHKYDVIDYKEIDPIFGDLDSFKELLGKAHEKGIKVILDFVFNHTSDRFFAFKDILENGEKSKYKDWYFIKEYPVKSYFDMEKDINECKQKGQAIPQPNYETFGFSQWNMPKIRIANEAVQEYFLNIIDYWVREIGIDGLRLDVADEIDHYFLELARKRIKKINPEVYLCGETWADAFPLLRGNELDGVTNYRFTYNLINFLSKKINSSVFNDRLAYLRTLYPRQGQLSSLNVLGSHDITRITSQLMGNKKLHKVALVFQMCYIGVPMVYYGDEIGMIGGGIEQRRAPMLWNSEERDDELFEFYKKLIKIRLDNPALQIGSFEVANKDSGYGIYSFIRMHEENIIFIILNNRSSSIKLKFELKELGIHATKFVDLICDCEYEISDGQIYISIGGDEAKILKAFV